MGLGALVVVMLSVSAQVPARRSADIPDDTIVARLSNAAMPDAKALAPVLAASRANPDDLPAAQAAASALISTGRKAGNSRLVGAALGVLRPFLAKDPDPETLRLAAEARQYQHDFNGALALLDRAITADPHLVDAVLMRSTIHLVQGDLALAEADCQRIHGLRPDIGFLCQATTLTLTDAAPGVSKRLQVIALQSDMLDPSLLGWAQSLMGEIAVLQGHPDEAATHLQAVIADNPFALRERLMLADLLLQQGKAGAVTTLLQDAPAVDGVLIRRALALRGTGDAGAAKVIEDEMATRVKLNLQLGLNAHAREDAMYFLLLANDPAQALERAKVNWALQHEIDDARLLITAAAAAGKPAEAMPVLDWMKANRIVVPSLVLPPEILVLQK